MKQRKLTNILETIILSLLSIIVALMLYTYTLLDNTKTD